MFDLRKFLSDAVNGVGNFVGGVEHNVASTFAPKQATPPPPASTARPQINHSTIVKQATYKPLDLSGVGNFFSGIGNAAVNATKPISQGGINPFADASDLVENKVVKPVSDAVIKPVGDTINVLGTGLGNSLAEYTGLNQSVQNQADQNRQDTNNTIAALTNKLNTTSDPFARQRIKTGIANINNIQNQADNAVQSYYGSQIAATDPHKILPAAGEAALDFATAGRGKALLDSIPLTTQITKGTLSTLARNASTTGAQGALVGGAYGGLNTAKDPNATVGDYAKDIATSAALGAGSGLAAGAVLPVAGYALKPLVSKISRDASAAANNIVPRRPTSLSDEELSSAARIHGAQQGLVDPQTITPQDALNYRNAESKLGLNPGTPDGTNAVAQALDQHRAYNTQVATRLAQIRGVNERFRSMIPGASLKLVGSDIPEANGQIRPEQQALPLQIGSETQPSLSAPISASSDLLGASRANVPTTRLLPDRQIGQVDTPTASPQTASQLGTGADMQTGSTGQEYRYTSSPQKSLNQRNGYEVRDPQLLGTNETQAIQPKTLLQGKQDLPSSNIRERGFIQSILDDPNTDSHIKENLSSLYQVRNSKELQVKAANLVKDNPDLAQRLAYDDASEVGQSIGSELISKLSKEGNYEQAINIAQRVAEKATENGRASQALAAYGKLTPQGILRFASNVIKDYNLKNKTVAGKQLKLTDAQAKSLTDKSSAIQSMSPGRDRDVAIASMLKEVYELIPSSRVQKIGTLQTMAQLLNPKTSIRNVVGNAMFGALDNVSQIPAAGIDKAISTFRGTPRTVSLPNIKTQFGGIVKGGHDAYEEALKGVSVGPNTQYELSDVPTFRTGIMNKLEKTMNVTLRVPDRAAYQATFDDTVRGLMKANNLDKPTQEIIEQANAKALYRTFQDNSRIATMFSGLKGELNKIGIQGKDGKRFGLGDLIVKYPKTPGNIISRGLDYSPVGVLKGIFDIANTVFLKQPFDQASFANNVSRGLVGSSALIGSGAVLGALGIITEKPSDDFDTRNLQKASGLGGYQINTSALRRFLLSGFDKSQAKLQKGDNLVSYDWAQPLSIPLSAGAAVGKGQDPVKGATNTIGSLSSGLNTLVEQPLVTGLSTFANNFKNKGAFGALGETAKGLPASFVPTAINQVKQLTDNTTRNNYDPNPINQIVNSVENKIPWLSQNLHPQVNALGQDNETYKNGTNNAFNVLFNPAFVNKYNPQDAANLPLDILNNTGNTKQIPTTTKTTQKVNGENLNLTPQQNEDFQRYVGTKTTEYLQQASNDPKFMSLNQEDQATRISQKIASIQQAAKIQVLGGSADKANKDVKSIVAGNTSVNSKSLGSKGGSNSDLYASNDAEYKQALDDYNQKVKDGTYSGAAKIRADANLAKEKVGADFSKNTRDYYGLSKAQLTQLVTTDPNGKQILNDVLAYGDALKDAGLATYNKFRNSRTGAVSLASTTGSKSTGTRRGRAAKDFSGAITAVSKLGSSNTSALRNLVKNSGKYSRRKVKA